MTAATPPRRTPDGAVEFRIGFSQPLRDAESVSTTAILPPLRKAVPPTAVPPTAAPPALSQTPTPALEARALHEEIRRQMLEEQAETQAAIAALRTAAQEVRRQFQTNLAEWQTAALELAMLLTTRLLRERFERNDFAIEATVREMVGHLVDETPIAIHMNPKDLELLERRLGGEPLLSGPQDPRLIPDPSFRRGEFRVDGRSSIIMTDIAELLASIRTEMLECISHARN